MSDFTVDVANSATAEYAGSRGGRHEFEFDGLVTVAVSYRGQEVAMLSLTARNCADLRDPGLYGFQPIGKDRDLFPYEGDDFDTGAVIARLDGFLEDGGIPSWEEAIAEALHIFPLDRPGEGIEFYDLSILPGIPSDDM